MRFTSLLPPPNFSFSLRSYFIRSTVLFEPLAYLVREFGFSKMSFQEIIATFPREFYKGEKFFFCEKVLLSFSPLNAFLSKAAFFIAATVT
jgi:hypothetical protein